MNIVIAMMSLTGHIFESFRNAEAYLPRKCLHGFKQTVNPFVCTGVRSYNLQPHLIYQKFLLAVETQNWATGN